MNFNPKPYAWRSLSNWMIFHLNFFQFSLCYFCQQELKLLINNINQQNHYQNSSSPSHILTNDKNNKIPLLKSWINSQIKNIYTFQLIHQLIQTFMHYKYIVENVLSPPTTPRHLHQHSYFSFINFALFTNQPTNPSSNNN